MSTYEITTDDGHVYQVETEDAQMQASTEPIDTRPTWGQSARAVGKMLVEGAGKTLGLIGDYNPLDPNTMARQFMPDEVAKEMKPSTHIQRAIDDAGLNPDSEGISGPVYDVAKGAVEALPFPGGPVANAAMGAGAEIAHQIAPDSSIAPFVGSLLGGGGVELFKSAPSIFKAGYRALMPTAEAQAKPAIEQGAKLVSELKDIAPGTFEDTLTTDARNQAVAQAISDKADAASAAASEAFANVPDAQVNIRPVRNYIARDLAAKEGLLNPDSQSRQIVKTLDEMMPPKEKTYVEPERILNENGWPMSQRNPKTGQMEPVFGGGGWRTTTPPAMVSLQKAQNILRDIGEAGTKAKGTWESTSLWGAKKSLTNAIERQLPEDASGALMDARKAWAEYKNLYDEGAAGAVRDVIENPDKRLDVFYSKLTQDTKTAGQLMKVMSPADVSNAQTLMLQEMMKEQPNSWGKHINKNLGVFETVFGKDGAANLTKWVNADVGSVGKTLLNRPTSLTQSLFYRPLEVILAGILGGPAVAVAATAGTYVRGAALKTRQIELGKLLGRFAAGDSEAATLLSKPATKENLSAVIPALLTFVARGGAIGMERESENSPKTEENKSNSVNSSASKPDNKAVEERIDANPYYSALYQAESGRNPKAKNAHSSAKGGFQFIDRTAKDIGLKDPMDLGQAFEAVQKLTEENKKILKTDDPEALYGAHVLGPGLYKKYLEGKTLSVHDQALVDYFENEALPNFRTAYNAVSESTGEA